MNVQVWCESDQGLVGVERITCVHIELEDGSSNDELASKVYNRLAGKEYFTEGTDWKNEVKKNVAGEIGCKVTDIEMF